MVAPISPVNTRFWGLNADLSIGLYTGNVTFDNLCEQIFHYFFEQVLVLRFKYLYIPDSFLDAFERCFIFVYCRLEDNKTKTVNSFLPEQKKRQHTCVLCSSQQVYRYSSAINIDQYFIWYVVERKKLISIQYRVSNLRPHQFLRLKKYGKLTKTVTLVG